MGRWIRFAENTEKKKKKVQNLNRTQNNNREYVKINMQRDNNTILLEIRAQAFRGGIDCVSSWSHSGVGDSV